MTLVGRFLPLLLLVALAVAPLLLPEFHVTLLNYIGLYALVALGLVILTGVGGVTSFGQAAFVGLGAYTSAYLTTVHGLSPWLTLPVGLALTTVVALTLGLVTLRLSGHFLPLGTIAWGISLYFLFGNLDALGGHTGMGGLPPLRLGDYELKSGQEYFYLIWLALLLAVFATRNLLDSREGRAVRALKGGSVMAEAMGVHTPRAKIVVFTLAALLASLSGWLYAHLQRFVNPTPFSLTQGIEYLFMAVVGGVSHVWGAIVGAGLITLLKQWLQDGLPRLLGESGNFEMIVFGVLMIVVLQRARDGVWPLLQRIFPPPPVRIPAGEVEPLPRRPRPAAGEVLLEVKQATKYFGGLCANDQVSFDVRAGEVMALIGPNGAGKSTLFDGISGVEPLTSGAVHFRGEPVEKLPAREIARRGLSRTFQHVRLLPAMSVLENVAIGAHLRGRQGLLAAACRADRVEEARLLREAARQLERCGLAEHFGSAAGSLPLGKQRLVEIARALAADPCLLLLDEPAAGLRYLEKQALDDLLRRLRDEGIGILLVEHDMDFVMGLADRVVVIEFGRKLATGRPDEIQRHPAVVQAYLGGVE
ncbi:MAG: branched-chain amino acid ABC transporter ATP-binding protein/permease [Candidatus Accumulibacter sp.]|nr:branched-chain amino acid ABC transporter ATP-binding protein/permease [Accumulibacter sp.]